MFEKGARGGIPYISNRCRKIFEINKNYLKSYVPKQELKHVIYLGKNYLYSYPMSKFLPTSGSKWTDLKECDLNKYTCNSLKGCALEVDVEYSKKLRELHIDYPLAPDKIEIKREMLCDYQLKTIYKTFLVAMLKN